MIKLADEPGGRVSGRRVHKTLTDLDRRRLAEGVAFGTEILGHFGAAPGGCRPRHGQRRPPGGTLALTRDSAASFHDTGCPTTSMWPTRACFRSRSNPPIPTIVAMAKRIGRLLAGEVLLGGGSPRPCER